MSQCTRVGHYNYNLFDCSKVVIYVFMTTGDLIDDNDTSEIGKTKFFINFIHFCFAKDKMLKTQVFEKDEMVAKLMKENLQLLEKLTLINDKSFDTKNIQCDYWTKTGM